MGRLKLLVLTTAFHHKHRYRLHSFLPYLSKYFDIDVVDVPLLSYDRVSNESLQKFLSRIIKEILSGWIKSSRVGDIRVHILRSLFPGEFGALTVLPAISILLNKVGVKYHVILASPFLAGLLALIAKRSLLGIPVIYEDVDRFYGFFTNPLQRVIAEAIELWTIRSSDYVIAASPHLYFEDRDIRSNKPTFFVPNGIEYEKFRESALKTPKRDRHAIVYVGAVEWWSGLDIALKAFAQAAREVPDIKLYIIGEHRSSFGSYLFKLAKKLGIVEKVFFLGRKPYDYIIKFLPQCRIGLLTFPRTEVTERAFPYKVLEYGAAGTPIVMTKVTVLAPLVEKYGAGIVYDVNDIEGLSSGIIELVVNDRLWAEYSINAIRLASLFDVSKLAELEAKIIFSARGGYDA